MNLTSSYKVNHLILLFELTITSQHLLPPAVLNCTFKNNRVYRLRPGGRGSKVMPSVRQEVSQTHIRGEMNKSSWSFPSTRDLPPTVEKLKQLRHTSLGGTLDVSPHALQRRRGSLLCRSRDSRQICLLYLFLTVALTLFDCY